jgi:hypothetical protein
MPSFFSISNRERADSFVAEENLLPASWPHFSVFLAIQTPIRKHFRTSNLPTINISSHYVSVKKGAAVKVTVKAFNYKDGNVQQFAKASKTVSKKTDKK